MKRKTALILANGIRMLYIWIMKFVAPIHRTGEYCTTVVKSNRNVVMYDVIIDHEIIGYFVGLTGPNPSLVEFNDKETADVFYDKLDMRVEMAKRGISLN